ncbi:MAG: hypothetical protein U0871_06110 [Gemmataceae bacterium]
MNDPAALALVMAVGLVVLGLVTGWWQVRGLRRLAARAHVPSDEYAYLRSKHRRRLLTAGILVTVGGLIGGAYLSGMERQADALGEKRAAPDDGPKPEMTPEQKQFVRQWGLYWIGVIVLVFALVGLAFVDAVATRRYWLTQLRTLREEHQSKLRRDLAVYKQHKQQTRGGRFGNRLGGDT